MRGKGLTRPKGEILAAAMRCAAYNVLNAFNNISDRLQDETVD